MALLSLTETMIARLLPKTGQQAKFLKHLEEIKAEKVLVPIIFFF